MKELSFPGNASSLLIMKSKHFNPHDTTFQDFKKETSLNPFKKSKSKKKRFLAHPALHSTLGTEDCGSERTDQSGASGVESTNQRPARSPPCFSRFLKGLGVVRDIIFVERFSWDFSEGGVATPATEMASEGPRKYRERRSRSDKPYDRPRVSVSTIVLLLLLFLILSLVYSRVLCPALLLLSSSLLHPPPSSAFLSL